MRRYLVFFLLFVVTACQVPKTPDEAYVLSTTTYLTATKAAITYGKLPRCITNGPTLCSKQSVVDQIKKASTIAVTAIDQATDVLKDPALTEDTKTTAVAAANAAIGTFSKIVETYKVK